MKIVIFEKEPREADAFECLRRGHELVLTDFARRCTGFKRRITVTAKQQKIETTVLSPNLIVRLKDGKNFFGYGPTVIAEKIKAGDIPEPVRLGDRARGWLGSQIVEWQQRLIDGAE